MMNQRNDQTIAHQAADVVDNAADGMRSAAHNVGGTVRNAAHSVREAAGRAADTVSDTYNDVSQRACDSVNHRRAQVRGWEMSLDSCVRDNPKKSLLLAAACGAALFAWMKR
jgi:ElaB/YqjD/DUF883 family membrane-anchored ribosome-binding protein